MRVKSLPTRNFTDGSLTDLRMRAKSCDDSSVTSPQGLWASVGHHAPADSAGTRDGRQDCKQFHGCVLPGGVLCRATMPGGSRLMGQRFGRATERPTAPERSSRPSGSARTLGPEWVRARRWSRRGRGRPASTTRRWRPRAAPAPVLAVLILGQVFVPAEPNAALGPLGALGPL
jgi:hypothetical protein